MVELASFPRRWDLTFTDYTTGEVRAFGFEALMFDGAYPLTNTSADGFWSSGDWLVRRDPSASQVAGSPFGITSTPSMGSARHRAEEGHGDVRMACPEPARELDSVPAAAWLEQRRAGLAAATQPGRELGCGRGGHDLGDGA